jgi:hypothetical protein
MNKVKHVGYIITRSPGVVDPSPLSIGYRKVERNVKVVVVGYGQSVCSLPSICARLSCIWPVACVYSFNLRVLFEVSFSFHMVYSCPKACL